MKKKGFTPLETIGRRQKAMVSLTGFTLLEILVAALIMALVMTGLASIFVASKRHILHARSRMQGGELGRLFLAPLQMDVTMSERSPGAQNGWGQINNCLTSDGTISGCPGDQTVDNIKYIPNYNISDVSGLRKVKVTVNWTEPSP